MTAWGLDLGTSNSALARRAPDGLHDRLITLPAICRRAEGDVAPPLVPSAVRVAAGGDLWTRLGRAGFVSRRRFWGRWGEIGQAALDANAEPSRAFAAGFKRFLGRADNTPMASVAGQPVTAREVAHVFLREMLAEVWRTTGERVRDLVVTTPVDAYESYRATLLDLLTDLGVRRVRFLDEPLAAALGYGATGHREVLVIDFGAGTLDLARVDLDGARARVLAKAGRPIGGDQVDDWLAAHVSRHLGLRPTPDVPFWQDRAREEARRVKELLWSRDEVRFHGLPPEQRREAQARGLDPDPLVTRRELEVMLDERGLFRALDELLDAVAPAGARVDDVLMIGGSTLLPGVFARVEGRFGRDRVRAFRPFEAVALGAAAYAAGGSLEGDHIVHDYALQLAHATTGEPEYLTVIPRGTPFPTAPAHWRQQLRPTCALGVPETFFKLIICEVGQARDDERLLAWDQRGELRVLRPGDRATVVPLNADHPALGVIDPPHQPNDPTPRLDVALGVNADRWLIATVRDTRTQRVLLREQPLVRLL